MYFLNIKMFIRYFKNVFFNFERNGLRLIYYDSDKTKTIMRSTKRHLERYKGMKKNNTKQ